MISSNSVDCFDHAATFTAWQIPTDDGLLSLRAKVGADPIVI